MDTFRTWILSLRSTDFDWNATKCAGVLLPISKVPYIDTYLFIGLGVVASTHAKLFVIVSPAGPYFPTGFNPISIFAECDAVRSWPGGTGAYKLGINYTPTFKPQREAAKKGYQQILWVLRGDSGDEIVTEVGQMNFFAVVERDDGGTSDGGSFLTDEGTTQLTSTFFLLLLLNLIP